MIDFNSGSWSPGTYGFVIALAIITVIVVWFMVAAFWSRYGEFGFFMTIAVLIGLTGYGFAGVAYYPFSEDFHKYYTVIGTVEDTNTRLVTTQDSSALVAVVTVGGNMFRIDDTRGTTLEKGDTVSLRCKREFEWNSVPGWGCKWNHKGDN